MCRTVKFLGCLALLAISLPAAMPAHAQQAAGTPAPQVAAPSHVGKPWNNGEGLEDCEEHQDIREERQKIRAEHEQLEAEHDKLKAQCMDSKGQDRSGCRDQLEALHAKRQALHERMTAMHTKVEQEHKECRHPGEWGVRKGEWQRQGSKGSAPATPPAANSQ